MSSIFHFIKSGVISDKAYCIWRCEFSHQGPYEIWTLHWENNNRLIFLFKKASKAARFCNEYQFEAEYLQGSNHIVFCELSSIDKSLGIFASSFTEKDQNILVDFLNQSKKRHC